MGGVLVWWVVWWVVGRWCGGSWVLVWWGAGVVGCGWVVGLGRQNTSNSQRIGFLEHDWLFRCGLMLAELVLNSDKHHLVNVHYVL